jgi:hypothetical protein
MAAQPLLDPIPGGEQHLHAELDCSDARVSPLPQTQAVITIIWA